MLKLKATRQNIIISFGVGVREGKGLRVIFSLFILFPLEYYVFVFTIFKSIDLTTLKREFFFI